MNPFEKELILFGVEEAISEIQKNQAGVDAFLGKEAGYGEADLVAYATKFGGPTFGAAVQAAITALSPELPKYEGDATAWVVASFEAIEKSLKA